MAYKYIYLVPLPYDQEFNEKELDYLKSYYTNDILYCDSPDFAEEIKDKINIIIFRKKAYNILFEKLNDFYKNFPNAKIQYLDENGILHDDIISKPNISSSEFFKENSRTEILRKASEIVTKDRNKEYGEPEDNFKKVADLWNAFLKYKNTLNEKDIALMMVLFKVARLIDGDSLDSWIDIAGYAACGGEISE